MSIDYKVILPNLNYIKQWTDYYTYQGYVNSITGLYEGEGRLKFLNPDNNIQEYIGSFCDGKTCENGIITYKDGSIYKGQTENLKRSGYGKMYRSDGKFQHESLWLDDKSNNPVYTIKYSNLGNIISQSYKYNNIIQGWHFTHDKNEIVTSIEFYHNTEIIKTMSFESCKFCETCNKHYKIKYNANQSNTKIYDFLFVELPKLKKPNYFHKFISDTNNLNILDSIVFSNSDEINTPFKLFNSDGLMLQQVIIDSENIVALVLDDNLNDKIIVGIRDKYSFKKASIYKCDNAKKIDNIVIIKSLSNNYYELEPSDKYKIFGQCEEIIYSTDIVKFYGKGWKLGSIEGTKYIGKFNKVISEGTEEVNGKKIYHGQFNHLCNYTGIGTLYDDSGLCKYNGQFINGKFQGDGTSFYSGTDSIEYVGKWFNGKKNGKGTLFSIIGEEIISGTFKNNIIL
jgi:hypothetical protein